MIPWRLPTLILSILVLLHTSAGAMSDPPRDELEQLMKNFAACDASNVARYYDCGCVSVNRMDLERELEQRFRRLGFNTEEMERERSSEAMRIQTVALERCVKADSIAYTAYGRCLRNTPLERTDNEDFCSCYAERYADLFTRYSTTLMFDAAQTQAQAIIDCNNAVSRAGAYEPALMRPAIMP